MKLTLEKIYLNLKMMSWKFVVPCLVASILAIVALIISCINASLVPIIISSLCALAFMGLVVGLFISTWLKYYKMIQDKVCGLYIIPNDSWFDIREANKKRFTAIVEHLADYVSTLCAIHGIMDSPKENMKFMKDVIVVFMDEISAKEYNERWGTNYKQINGLYNGQSICVVYNKSHLSLLDTALEYELSRVIMVCLKHRMPIGTWTEINKRLGITQW